MGQVSNMLERPTSALAKPSTRFEQHPQMYRHLPFAAGMKPTGRPQQSRHKGQLKVSPKSICVDAEELRRRLNVVLEEQNHRKARQRQRPPPVSEGQGQARGQVEVAASSTTQGSLNPARPRRYASARGQQPSRPASALEITTQPLPTARSHSRQDQLRSAEGEIEPAKTIVRSSSRATTVDAAGQTQPLPKVRRSYSTSKLNRSLSMGSSVPSKHTPRNAAAHFSDTATTQNMQNKQLIHPLAREAFEKQEHARLAEQARCNSSSLTGKTWNLKRSRSQQLHHGAAYERNQFQDGSLTLGSVSHSRDSIHGTGFPTKKGAGMDNIFEDEEFVATQKRQAERGRLEKVTSAEFADIVNDRRIDWTQTDESEKKRSSLLQALWTRKPAEAKSEPAALQPASATSKNKVRPPKISTKGELSPSSSALPIPGLKSPKSPLAFLTKFRRQQLIKI
ncbi:uncharacterized protein B0I36DRAFT_310638 [Microdochium trichocladiopsis]|uniref:Uncharacterized protein n=1 Tax=Microdochium trichocladiopsis TaxID=1682393 RepID=A0A9P8YJZ6_9PEZI|nr:uncharacterized protein B0I36DRAFT_310638 [Microdochium trichocladiopsis]KAH7040420.1 hypothetical protein B0I36DRAFT_310638 [Microdochium trichocladiopsis]